MNRVFLALAIGLVIKARVPLDADTLCLVKVVIGTSHRTPNQTASGDENRGHGRSAAGVQRH